MDHRLKCKILKCKTFRKNRRKSLGFSTSQRVFELDIKTHSIKGKTDKLNFTKIKNPAL